MRFFQTHSHFINSNFNLRNNLLRTDQIPGLQIKYIITISIIISKIIKKQHTKHSNLQLHLSILLYEAIKTKTMTINFIKMNKINFYYLKFIFLSSNYLFLCAISTHINNSRDEKTLH